MNNPNLVAVVDIETLGKGTDAVIGSIGVVMRQAASCGMTPEALAFAADHATRFASRIRREVSGHDIQPGAAS